MLLPELLKNVLILYIHGIELQHNNLRKKLKGSDTKGKGGMSLFVLDIANFENFFDDHTF
jgi:hypothetical protein